MKYAILCLLVSLVGLGACATEPWEVNLYEAHHHEDAPVVLSDLAEAVRPESMPDGSLRALIVPFAVRQDVRVRKDIARELTDIFRLAWLESQVFDILEYDASRPWPGLDAALAQARAKKANILVTGNISQFFSGGRTGTTSIGLTVEVYWVPSGTLLWSAARSGLMEYGPDKDYALVRSTRRLPEDPLYAVMRTLSLSMAERFARYRE